MSPEFPAACVPATTCEEIVSPPCAMSVQPVPRLPSGRLKLSEATVAAVAFWGSATKTVPTVRRAPRMNDLDRIDRSQWRLGLCMTLRPPTSVRRRADETATTPHAAAPTGRHNTFQDAS